MAKKSMAHLNLKRHAIMLGDQDRENLEKIKNRLGIYDDSTALRMSAKIVASATAFYLPPVDEIAKQGDAE